MRDQIEMEAELIETRTQILADHIPACSDP